jgi:hypothetical protein
MSGKVRAVFPGDATRGRLESASRAVTVLPKMEVRLGRRDVRLGSSVQAKGSAVPADTVRLTLDRRVRRHWVRERNRVLTVRKGQFKVRLRPRNRGRYRLMVQKGRVKRRRAMRVF